MITPDDDFDDGPYRDADDPLTVLLRPPSGHLGPPAGRYEEIRRRAGRRRLWRTAAGAGAAVAVAVAAFSLLPAHLTAPGPPASPTVPLAPPPVRGTPTAPTAPESPAPAAPGPTEGTPTPVPDLRTPGSLTGTADPTPAATREPSPVQDVPSSVPGTPSTAPGRQSLAPSASGTRR